MTKIFSIFDSKAKVFGVPFFMPSVGMAIRAFGDLVNERGSLVNKHPEDFTLFEIGKYDDNLGLVEEVPVVSLGMAVSLLRTDLSKQLPLFENGVVVSKEVVK